MTHKKGGFDWSEQSTLAALLLAEGKIEQEVADEVGVSRSTISRWKRDSDFMQSVNNTTLTHNIALRAGRLRIAMRAINEKLECEKLETKKDLLDWLKYAKGEADEIVTDFFTGNMH